MGQNKRSFPQVRGTKGGSREQAPLRIEPERGQVAEYDIKSVVTLKKGGDVLDEDIKGLQLSNQPGELFPQARARALKPSTTPGIRQVLAGKAARKYLDGRQVVGSDVAHVLEARDTRPVARQDLAAVGIDLDLEGALEAGPLQAEIQAAHAGEERAKGQRCEGQRRGS